MPTLLESRKRSPIRTSRFPTSGAFDLEIVGSENALGKISGDLFEIVETGPDAACIAMGDACGHGVAAGMLVVDVRRLLSMMAETQRDPGRMLTEMNRNVMRRFPTCRFVTLTLLAIDRNTLNIRYASAGQAFYRIPAAGEAIRCDCENSPIGVFEDEEFTTLDSGALQPGELLVLISDGFAETQSRDRGIYGEERLLRQFTENRACDSGEIISKLFTDVDTFKEGHSDHDDMTVVIVRLVPRTAG